MAKLLSEVDTPDSGTSTGAGRRGPASRETRRLYAGDWAGFERWCARRGLAALPASPATLAAFLAEQGATLGAGTLTRYAAAVSDRHRREGQGSPAASPCVRDVLRQARQTERAVRAESPQPVAPVRRRRAPDPAHWIATAASCGNDLAGVRDRAVLLLVASGLDHDGLLGLDRDGVRLTDAGAELTLETMDVDGEPGGAPRIMALRRSEVLASCPVRALETWLRRSDTEFGPVFRRVDRWGNVEHEGLSSDGLRRILQRLLANKRRGRSRAG